MPASPEPQDVSAASDCRMQLEAIEADTSSQQQKIDAYYGLLQDINTRAGFLLYQQQQATFTGLNDDSVYGYSANVANALRLGQAVAAQVSDVDKSLKSFQINTLNVDSNTAAAASTSSLTAVVNRLNSVKNLQKLIDAVQRARQICQLNEKIKHIDDNTVLPQSTKLLKTAPFIKNIAELNRKAVTDPDFTKLLQILTEASHKASDSSCTSQPAQVCDEFRSKLASSFEKTFFSTPPATAEAVAAAAAAAADRQNILRAVLLIDNDAVMSTRKEGLIYTAIKKHYSSLVDDITHAKLTVDAVTTLASSSTTAVSSGSSGEKILGSQQPRKVASYGNLRPVVAPGFAAGMHGATNTASQSSSHHHRPSEDNLQQAFFKLLQSCLHDIEQSALRVAAVDTALYDCGKVLDINVQQQICSMALSSQYDDASLIPSLLCANFYKSALTALMQHIFLQCANKSMMISRLLENNYLQCIDYICSSIYGFVSTVRMQCKISVINNVNDADTDADVDDAVENITRIDFVAFTTLTAGIFNSDRIVAVTRPFRTSFITKSLQAVIEAVNATLKPNMLLSLQTDAAGQTSPAAVAAAEHLTSVIFARNAAGYYDNINSGSTLILADPQLEQILCVKNIEKAIAMIFSRFEDVILAKFVPDQQQQANAAVLRQQRQPHQQQPSLQQLFAIFEFMLYLRQKLLVSSRRFGAQQQQQALAALYDKNSANLLADVFVETRCNSIRYVMYQQLLPNLRQSMLLQNISSASSEPSAIVTERMRPLIIDEFVSHFVCSVTKMLLPRASSTTALHHGNNNGGDTAMTLLEQCMQKFRQLGCELLQAVLSVILTSSIPTMQHSHHIESSLRYFSVKVVGPLLSLPSSSSSDDDDVEYCGILRRVMAGNENNFDNNLLNKFIVQNLCLPQTEQSSSSKLRGGAGTTLLLAYLTGVLLQCDEKQLRLAATGDNDEHRKAETKKLISSCLAKDEEKRDDAAELLVAVHVQSTNGRPPTTFSDDDGNGNDRFAENVVEKLNLLLVPKSLFILVVLNRLDVHGSVGLGGSLRETEEIQQLLLQHGSSSTTNFSAETTFKFVHSWWFNNNNNNNNYSSSVNNEQERIKSLQRVFKLYEERIHAQRKTHYADVYVLLKPLLAHL